MLIYLCTHNQSKVSFVFLVLIHFASAKKNFVFCFDLDCVAKDTKKQFTLCVFKIDFHKTKQKECRQHHFVPKNLFLLFFFNHAILANETHKNTFRPVCIFRDFPRTWNFSESLKFSFLSL